MFKLYSFCPRAYWERYEYVPEVQRPVLPELGSEAISESDNGSHARVGLSSRPSASLGIELDEARPDRDFGTRFHQLVENQRRELLALPLRAYESWPDAAIESECQSTFAAYRAHWVVEPLVFLSAERTLRINIPRADGQPGPHSLIVKIDAHVRHGDGSIGPLDTKTERPGSSSNGPESWASRTQASLYLWALEKLYPTERVSRMVVDVITRGNSKRPAVFRRMDDISRSPEALHDAILCLTEVAESISRDRTRGWFRADMNRCIDGWKKCEYYALHVLGRTEATLARYKPADKYLDI